MKLLEENIKEAKICMSLGMGQTDSVHLDEETVGFTKYVNNWKVTNLHLLSLIKIPGYSESENKNLSIIYSFLAVIYFFIYFELWHFKRQRRHPKMFSYIYQVWVHSQHQRKSVFIKLNF